MNNANFGAPKVKSTYTAWCYSHFHADGSRCESPWACPHGLSFERHDHKLKWIDGFENLVVTEGLNALLDNTFNAAAGSVSWYVGLKGTGTVAAGDTMSSHSGWSDIVPYSNASRPAWTKNGAASSGQTSNSSSKATFNINGSSTVYGAFLTSDNTKSGTSGALYGAGDFSSSRAVVSGDTLNVQIDLSVTSS